MRFVLRLGTREVLVCTRDRFLRFTHLTEAAEFLADYVLAPVNYRLLRDTLALDPQFDWLRRKTQTDFVVHVAEMLVNGEVNVLTDPDAEPPWTWTFPITPNFHTEGAEAEGEDNPLADWEDEINEAEAEYEDVKPEPVIPPEFPRLAQSEADAVDFETKKYQTVMELMKHVEADVPPGSELAKQFSQLAASQGDALHQEVSTLGPQLRLALNGEAGPFAESQLGPELRSTAEHQKVGLKTVADKVGDFLKAVLLGGGAAAAAAAVSGLGKNIRDLAGHHGDVLGERAKELGEKMDGLAEAAKPPAERPAVQLPELPPDNAVHLSFTKANGEPLANQALLLVSADGEETKAWTDADGRAELSGLPEGPYTMKFPEVESPFVAPQPKGDDPAPPGEPDEEDDPWPTPPPAPPVEAPAEEEPDEEEPDEEEPDEEEPAPPDDEPVPEPVEIVEETEDPDDYVLLFDTKESLLYRVHRSMFAEMKADAKELARLREAMKKAKEHTSADERANAMSMTTKELHDFCGTPLAAEDDPKVSKMPEGRRRLRHQQYRHYGMIREFIDFHSQEFVYVPSKRQGAREDRLLHRWKEGELKDALDMDQAKEEEWKRGTPVEIKWESDWKAAGEGSIMDWVDSGDPTRYLPFILAAPLTAPVFLLDWFAEKYPSVFRKVHKGKYEWADKSKYFDAGYEAAFLRYTYEAQALEVIWNPKWGQVRVAGKVAGEVDIAKGKTHVSWLLPDKQGAALPLPLKPNKAALRVRVELKGEVSGFVGAVAELSYEGVVDFSVKDKAKGDSKCPVELGLGAGLNAFAGASVTGELGLGVQWWNERSGLWKTLARVAGSATGFVGAAAVFYFRIGWDPDRGVFTFEYKAGLALKFGIGGGIRGECDVNEVLAMLGLMMERVDFHFIGEVAKEAFEAYTRFCLGMAVNAVRIMNPAALRAAEAFMDWAGGQAEIQQLAENINAGRAEALLELGPPEAKGAAIGKLCDRSILLPDETEEEAIIRVLRSSRSDREFSQILKKVTAENSVEAGIEAIDGAVDFGEQSDFDDMLEQRGLR